MKPMISSNGWRSCYRLASSREWHHLDCVINPGEVSLISLENEEMWLCKILKNEMTLDSFTSSIAWHS